VTSLVAFVREHAASINSGRVTPGLEAVTTPRELARQRAVVDYAVAKGYVVPSTPVIRVRSVLDESASSKALAACLWLPSTEYLDRETGEPPNGPVPSVWAPAVATVRLVDLTWSVDNLRRPEDQTKINCGSDP